MATIATISSSPSVPSRTDAVLDYVTKRLISHGHTVTPIVLRDLPAEPLLRGQADDPAISAAASVLENADAVVVTTPVYKAAYSGLLKVFLDLLPQYALKGKTVLPLATGGTPAHVLVIDYALRPVLTSLGAGAIGQGWFVLSSHVQLYDGGGLLLDPVASVPLYQVTEAFLATVEGEQPVESTPVQIAAVEAIRARPEDPEAAPLLADLVVEYSTRYGRTNENTQLTEVPPSDFHVERGGAFVLLRYGGQTVAGGAIRRYDDETAEVKRMWTSHLHRRQGLGRRVLAELESAALDLGYRRLYLTTGPRQPEAAGLYLSVGFEPQFDIEADPESIGPLPFSKDLPVALKVAS
ncbi:NADPH-dependent FMN reductase [Kribbella sp. VKM Ac-2566]|uniref:NADPH-dependent FMN reductase n=1 Tax=Kribbella sp. VKM Ac-2566 TaxID=2512218 RepID=UPI001063C831|nr:NADPH-dependent FMN reductase [Kribbella sp. VKM Ac-2566]TDW88839.1 SsuE family FMN reductase [Kribbella sp. VKM Ac-2566]